MRGSIGYSLNLPVFACLPFAQEKFVKELLQIASICRNNNLDKLTPSSVGLSGWDTMNVHTLDFFLDPTNDGLEKEVLSISFLILAFLVSIRWFLHPSNLVA